MKYGFRDKMIHKRMVQYRLKIKHPMKGCCNNCWDGGVVKVEYPKPAKYEQTNLLNEVKFST